MQKSPLLFLFLVLFGKMALAVTVIGHRGACGYAPDNTAASFKKAIELGVEIIELDIHPCKSGELIVIHDSIVDRISNGTGEVINMTLAELKTLDFGQGEHILTLQEALDVINKKAKVLIDIKTDGGADRIATILHNYVQNHGWSYDMFGSIGFFYHDMQKLALLCPGVWLIPSLMGSPLDLAQSAEDIGAEGVCFLVYDHRFFSKKLLSDTKQRGIKTVFYAEDGGRPSTVKRLIELYDIDAIITNWPDAVQAMIDRLEQ